jgi:exopolyphosphatase/guanosine-5'-triphosphate,3'-diphosphate pyrophosphatase
MEEQNYPLHVLQQYAIPRGRALRLSKVLSGLSRKSLEKIDVVSKRRAEALPYGAIALERLILATNARDVVVSANGLREGLLFAQLAPDERAKDPLLEYAAGANAREARSPEHAYEIMRWSDPLFGDDSQELRRVREAAYLFCDVGWRRHPDDRAQGAFHQVLTAPFTGADHRARSLIASSVLYRYSGDEDAPQELARADLLTPDDETRALRIGLSARLAFELSGSATGELQHYRLRLTPTRVLLEVPRRREMIAGESTQKRLGALAAAYGRKGEILVG